MAGVARASATGGPVTTDQEARPQAAWLRGELQYAGRSVYDGAAVPADYQWHEAVLLVAGLDDGQAVHWAAAYGQAAAVRWDAEALTVLPTGLVRPVPPSRSGWTAVREHQRSCPMGPPRPEGRTCCHMNGMFSVRGREGFWQHLHDRRVALKLLGCTTCSAGPGS